MQTCRRQMRYNDFVTLQTHNWIFFLLFYHRWIIRNDDERRDFWSDSQHQNIDVVCQCLLVLITHRTQPNSKRPRCPGVEPSPWGMSRSPRHPPSLPWERKPFPWPPWVASSGGFALSVEVILDTRPPCSIYEHYINMQYMLYNTIMFINVKYFAVKKYLYCWFLDIIWRLIKFYNIYIQQQKGEKNNTNKWVGRKPNSY